MYVRLSGLLYTSVLCACLQPVGNAVPKGRESCSRCLGPGFPTGWERSAQGGLWNQQGRVSIAQEAEIVAECIIIDFAPVAFHEGTHQ